MKVENILKSNIIKKIICIDIIMDPSCVTNAMFKALHVQLILYCLVLDYFWFRISEIFAVYHLVQCVIICFVRSTPIEILGWPYIREKQIFPFLWKNKGRNNSVSIEECYMLKNCKCSDLMKNDCGQFIGNSFQKNGIQRWLQMEKYLFNATNDFLFCLIFYGIKIKPFFY